MKAYEFGDRRKPVILLLPGTCCHWKNTFGEVIPLLERSFYVVCVSYDGFDETENTVFPSMIEETEKIEAYIQDRFAGTICCAYGCSLGGSFVGLLVQRGKIHIDHGILGSSDLDQANKISANISSKSSAVFLHLILQGNRFFRLVWLCMTPFQKNEYLQKLLSMFGISDKPENRRKMSFIKKDSIYNQAYSDLVTPLGDRIAVEGTMIHCFYAEKMGKKYLQRYKKHFVNPDIRHHPMQHEELFVLHPQEWVYEVESCCSLLIK